MMALEIRSQDRNESAFHFLCCKEPPLEDKHEEYEWEIWEKVGAQHGQLRMAAAAGAKGKSSGLRLSISS